MRPRLSKLFVLLSLACFSAQAQAYNWELVPSIQANLDEASQTKIAFSGAAGFQASPEIELFNAKSQRLKDIANRTNIALQTRLGGNQAGAENMLAGVCTDLSSLVSDMDLDLQNAQLQGELRFQFQSLRDDARTAIDGIGCYATRNYFEGRPLQSFYEAGGQQIQAVVIISGSGGSYSTNQGLHGIFSNIRYSNEGKSLEGTWSAAGQSGWMKFDMYDTQSGAFSGFWGSQGQPDIKGRWNGSY